MYNADNVARLHGDIQTNIGTMPMIDYLEIRIQQTYGQHDCESLYEFLEKGYQLPEFPGLTLEDYLQYEDERVSIAEYYNEILAESEAQEDEEEYTDNCP